VAQRRIYRNATGFAQPLEQIVFTTPTARQRHSTYNMVRLWVPIAASHAPQMRAREQDES
jgi:hypothetical protein